MEREIKKTVAGEAGRITVYGRLSPGSEKGNFTLGGADSSHNVVPVIN